MTNERPLHTIIDCETNTTIQVPFTDEEWAARLEEDARMQQIFDERKAAEEAQAAAKASAQAKLAALGLTQEEISALY